MCSRRSGQKMKPSPRHYCPWPRATGRDRACIISTARLIMGVGQQRTREQQRSRSTNTRRPCQGTQQGETTNDESERCSNTLELHVANLPRHCCSIHSQHASGTVEWKPWQSSNAHRVQVPPSHECRAGRGHDMVLG